MSVKIRLKRLGKIRQPQYRVVIMDSRTKRDGRAIEEIGTYHPKEEPSLIEIDSDRAQYWLGVGAQPTEQVAALLKITGDWQKFKGEPGAEGTLKKAPEKVSKRDLYEAALKAAQGEAPADNAPKKSEKKTEKKAAPVEPVETKAEKKADEPAQVAATDGGFGADSAAANEDGSAPEGFTVKGNKDSMKFHVEGSRWYDATEAEVWFRTAEAAVAAGFEPAGGDAAQQVSDESADKA